MLIYLDKIIFKFILLKGAQIQPPIVIRGGGILCCYNLGGEKPLLFYPPFIPQSQLALVIDRERGVFDVI